MVWLLGDQVGLEGSHKLIHKLAKNSSSCYRLHKLRKEEQTPVCSFVGYLPSSRLAVASTDSRNACSTRDSSPL